VSTTDPMAMVSSIGVETAVPTYTLAMGSHRAQHQGETAPRSSTRVRSAMTWSGERFLSPPQRLGRPTLRTYSGTDVDWNSSISTPYTTKLSAALESFPPETV
jgi:hypothetical protein